MLPDEKPMTEEELEASLLDASPEGEESPGELEEEVRLEAEAPPPKTAEELATEVENLNRAVREERETKKAEREMFSQALGKLIEAQQTRVAPTPQPAEELDDDDKYWLQKAQKFLSPYLQQHQAMLSAMEAQRQQQSMVSQYDLMAQEYRQANPDFEPAVKHFGTNLRRKAQILFKDNPQAQQVYVEQQIAGAMQFPPDRLYQYICEAEGYKPGQSSASSANPAAKSTGVQPRSLAAVPGASPGRAMTLQEKAQRIIDMDMQSLKKMSQEDFDKVLRDFKE